ncbi:putative membrane protein YccC [Streptacidiphilus sp. MAP12-16]|uniref:FUSC family protein n=1 Tax=Streptacidiphilus sp. MAP12-16 TaxID=3156300 RepID=UPI003512EC17
MNDRTPLPAWLAHALRWQKGPVPWGAVVRGALGAGPLLALAVLAGHPSAGVLAALGAMLAGVNDRPGSRRSAVPRLGLPALAGACGMLLGSALAAVVGGGAVALTAALAVLGFVAGALSSVGPVASSSGTQLLVAAVVGAGMPLPEPAWLRAVLYLAGGCWLLALRVALPSPGRPTGPYLRDYLLDGEREAIAAAYEAVADLLQAAGSGQALRRRALLTAALDRAQDALSGPRLRRHATGSAERRLHAQFAAVLPLAEAATALTWEGEVLPERAAEGPRRLAQAVRTSTAAGPLPAPVRSNAGLRALDEALLRAAQTFGGPDGHAVPAGVRAAVPPALRGAFGPAGHEYGIRVALCIGASAAAAQALHPHHWYWLPATAVFLVKPDLGPLASRVICRALGTIAGALAFAAVAATLPGHGWLPALAVLCGALLPVATRHFAVQTSVVTVLVLSFSMLGGDVHAAGTRMGDTLLACAIVLLVGHLPLPGRGGRAVSARLAAASQATHQYVGHVLARPEDGTVRPQLRRAAYRSLADARSAVELAAAELPPLARHSSGSARLVAELERLADAATACAVGLDSGAGADGGVSDVPSITYLRRLSDEWEDLARRTFAYRT